MRPIESVRKTPGRAPARLFIRGATALLLTLSLLAGCDETALLVGSVGGRDGGSGGSGGAPSGGPDAGSGGSGGGLPPGCAMANDIFMSRCVICHGTATARSFGGFDMEMPGWAASMVGRSTPADAPATNTCKNLGLVYLEVGTQPATGLFLDKLKAPIPPCGVQMPQLPPKIAMNSAEINCIQNWANNIVAGGNGF